MGWEDFFEFSELFFNREMWRGMRWCGMLLEFVELFLIEKCDVIWSDVACYLNFKNYFSMEKGDMLCGDFLKFLELFFNEKDDVA
jgi:hypothetical protein